LPVAFLAASALAAIQQREIFG